MSGFELVLVHQATFPYIRNDAPRDEQWRVGAALQAVSRNHPETRGNPPFCGTMSRGNERDLAKAPKKRCADKYIEMSRDIAFLFTIERKSVRVNVCQ